MSVVVLSKPNCVQCSATERALTKSGIEFTKRDMTQDEEAYDLAVSLGYQAAPVVIAGDQHWGGFRPEKIASLVA